MRRGACLRAMLAAALVGGAPALAPVQAGELFRCGRTFQDRPCETVDVQQRFSRAEGTFAIEQVHPRTDRDCARTAAEAMTAWERLAQGESMDRLQGEIQAHRISRYEKSLLRDTLTVVGSQRGTPTEVRSQFELQCMAYKRRHGYPSARNLAGNGYTTPAETVVRRSGIVAVRDAAARARAGAARERTRR